MTDSVKIHLLSDLHLEHWGPYIEPLIHHDSASMTLVIAGDLCPLNSKYKDRAIKALETFSKAYYRVVWVRGNHEFYGAQSWSEVVDASHDADRFGNVFLLDNEAFTIDGFKFFGGTMWYDYITDQVQIPGLWNPMFAEAKTFAATIRNTVLKDRIVVTHHLPSMKCVHKQYENDPVNGYFVRAQDEHIAYSKPLLWLHGHTHSPVDITVAKTRIVANPRGYPNERFDYDPFKAVFLIENSKKPRIVTS